MSLLIRQNSTVRLLLRVYDWTPVAGNLGIKQPTPVTGLLPADVSGAVCGFMRGDGTSGTIALVNGVTWFELGNGAYVVLADSTVTSVVGTLAYGISLGAGWYCEGEWATVENFPSLIWDELRSNHVINGTYGALMRLLRQMLEGRTKTDPVAGTRTTYAEDDTTPLVTKHLKDQFGNPAGLNATEVY